MKEKLKNKKFVYTIIGIISVLLVVVAVTYAYWLVTERQEGENVVTSACLDISLNGSNDITLSNQFPLSDEDGKKLTPYEFTITNNCNTSVDYQVALEALGEESDAISASALKVMLNEDAPVLLSSNKELDTTISGAYTSYRLATGTLAEKNAKATYTLRLWIDENASIDEMNKTFRSKITVTIGQGIEIAKNPYEEGTLAYDIVSNYFPNKINEIDLTDYDHRIITNGSLNIYNKGNYYYGTDYNYDEEGNYTLSGTITQATLEECRAGQKSDGTAITCGKYTLNSSNASKRGSGIWEIVDFQTSEEGNYAIANYISYENEAGAEPTYATLNKTEDDFGYTYYFRGNVTNNYVQFGSYASGSTVNGITYEKDTPIYWRIVRINGDGTIRIAYDGDEKAKNGENHTATVANTQFNLSGSEEGVRYGDSTIKEAVDTWYINHLKTNYGKYIADAIFCNDTEVTRYNYLDENWNSVETAEDAYYINKRYAGFDRLYPDIKPSLKCTQKTDRYTMNSENGNGLLSNPIGLLTMDEAVLAGGVWSGIHQLSNSNKNYFLYSSEDFWLLTPREFAHSTNGANVFCVIGSRGIYVDMVYEEGETYGVRPVINLKADIKFTGDGSFETPYEIVMN